MGYTYDPSGMGVSQSAYEGIQTGNAPKKLNKYLDYYNYQRGQAKLDAWKDKRALASANKSAYDNYLVNWDATNQQFDRQVRDLRNFASQRNWGRGSSTAGQENKTVGNWKKGLENLNTNYKNTTSDLKRQLEEIDKQLKMNLEGIDWKERNPDYQW